MTTSDQQSETPRQALLEAAQKELIAFEKKEREFRQRSRPRRLSVASQISTKRRR